MREFFWGGGGGGCKTAALHQFFLVGRHYWVHNYSFQVFNQPFIWIYNINFLDFFNMFNNIHYMSMTRNKRHSGSFHYFLCLLHL